MMSDDQISFLQQKIAKYNQEIQKQNGLIDELSTSTYKLEYSISNKKGHINEQTKKVDFFKDNIEEMSSKIIDLKWQQMKLNFNRENEKNKLQIYIDKMNTLKDRIDKGKLVAQNNIQQIDISEKIDESYSLKKTELRNIITQCEFDINEYQEKCNAAEIRNTILMKRNAATLLKLRNTLKELENQKNQLMRLLEKT